MDADHVIRLCVRVHAGAFHRETDLEVPATSSVTDITDEVAWLVGAPKQPRPWQAVTAAGRPIEPTDPLGAVGLSDGAVLVLEPQARRSRPVPRDAAEALVHAAGDAPRSGGPAEAAAAVGLLAAVALCWTRLPDWAGVAAPTLAAFALVAWRRLTVPAVAVPVGCALAAGLWVAGGPVATGAPAGGWAFPAAPSAGLAAGLAGAVAVGLLRPARLHVAWAAGIAAWAAPVAAGLAAGALPVPQPLVTGFTVLLSVGLALGWWAPALAQSIAGLKVPRLPTAGGDLADARPAPDDVDARARLARRLHCGVVCGAAAATEAGLVAIGWWAPVAQSGFVVALSACVAGASLLHALRHVDAVALWAHFAVALCGLAAAALAAAGAAEVAVVALLAALAVSAPVWVDRLAEPEPTTLVWWERAESVALAAAVPLAAHVAGVFSWLRGLG